jgi:hypothetical protein
MAFKDHFLTWSKYFAGSSLGPEKIPLGSIKQPQPLRIREGVLVRLRFRKLHQYSTGGTNWDRAVARSPFVVR